MNCILPSQIKIMNAIATTTATTAMDDSVKFVTAFPLLAYDSSLSMVHLSASDGAEMQIPLEHLKVSIFINSMVTDAGDIEEGDNSDPIELTVPTAVSIESLHDLARYCALNAIETQPTVPRPIRTNDMVHEVGATFGGFIEELKTDVARLRNLILVADFLDIPSLMDLSGAALVSVAMAINFNSTTDPTNPFGVPKMTEDDVKTIIQENPWILE